MLDRLCHASLQGKRIGDVANRMHVALPKPRDGVTRPPTIPASVAAARARSGAAASTSQPTEKDLQASRFLDLTQCFECVRF